MTPFNLDVMIWNEPNCAFLALRFGPGFPEEFQEVKGIAMRERGLANDDAFIAAIGEELCARVTNGRMTDWAQLAVGDTIDGAWADETAEHLGTWLWATGGEDRLRAAASVGGIAIGVHRLADDKGVIVATPFVDDDDEATITRRLKTKLAAAVTDDVFSLERGRA